VFYEYLKTHLHTTSQAARKKEEKEAQLKAEKAQQKALVKGKKGDGAGKDNAKGGERRSSRGKGKGKGKEDEKGKGSVSFQDSSSELDTE
jgi:hypothetical protein